MPMPAAVSTFLETPRKGQIPKNWDHNVVVYETCQLLILNRKSDSFLFPPYAAASLAAFFAFMLFIMVS